MFKRTGINNSKNGYGEITQMLANRDSDSNNDAITGNTEKYIPPFRRERHYSPPRHRNSSPRQRNYSPPRQSNYSRNQRDYSLHSQRNYSPPRQRNYLQPKQRNYSPPSPRQSNYAPLKTSKYFSSSELKYKGSDKLVFITDGEQIKDSWNRVLRQRIPLSQNDVKIFVISVLLAVDSQTGYKVKELVKELGSSEGIKKLREIINFPSMSCDAGLDSWVLSFQYVVLPLLGVLTRTAITECTLENYVHAIFMVVYTNLVSTINELNSIINFSFFC